ncbi:putative senescence regulator S40 [Dioscorea sansibarensis]
MERFRPHRSPRQDRFLGIFSRLDPVAPAINGGFGVELHEDEVLWTVSDSPELIRSPRTPSHSMPSALDHSRASPFSRIPERNSGILVALDEEEGKQLSDAVGPFLQRKASISASSASTSPSSASSVRMIPTIPKLKPDYNDGKMLHQSAPVNIPMIPSVAKHRPEANGLGTDADDVVDGDDDEMLPPHEIIARRSGVESPMTTFSVLEGVGRTLKGSDLRRVRNAVWRKTETLDEVSLLHRKCF